MQCPHCESADTSERRERMELGYRRFRCRTCQREFNERTAFAGFTTKYGTSCGRAHAGMKLYRSHDGDSCTRPVPMCC